MLEEALKQISRQTKTIQAISVLNTILDHINGRRGRSLSEVAQLYQEIAASNDGDIWVRSLQKRSDGIVTTKGGKKENS